MQFANNATGQDICTLADKLSKQNVITYPLTEKVTDANTACKIILTEIHNAYGGWKYDDKNNTDFPIAKSDLVSGQSDYSLPVDTNMLNAVYVLQEGSTDNWTKLIPITIEEINGIEAEPAFQDTDSTPMYYRAIGNSVKIYPASDYSLTGGIMVEYSGDISGFATTDTTKTPGFDSMFHEAVPYYMAQQFATINSLAVKDDRKLEWQEWLLRIKRHYSQKFRDMFPPRMKIRNDINDYI